MERNNCQPAWLALFAGALVLSLGASVHATLLPVVTESGQITVSIDGLGTNNPSGIISADKPAGAVVRSAYMIAATQPFGPTEIADGAITIDGTGVNWDLQAFNDLGFGNPVSNHFADVTAIVKPTIDAAPTGIVDFVVAEAGTNGIDGEILVVIFDDPAVTTSNTVILLFGGQDIDGDTFNIGLAEPLSIPDPELIAELSLGISFSFQGSTMSSLIDVNGSRLTSSAGGQDDGAGQNGALLTAGGIDDLPDNPADPFALPNGDPGFDDELYNLVPFVNDGDMNIVVETINPSDDDNIFFASLFLSVPAIVGEGIVLGPAMATNPIGTDHTVTALVQDDNGDPIVDREVTFTVVAGPHAGATGMMLTNASGMASFTYTGTIPGVDTIEASFVDSSGQTQTSNQVTKEWTPPMFDDCNGNGIDDLEDIASGFSLDCNFDGVPDECDPIDDCNGNGVPDECDVGTGASPDCNGNGTPDECEPDSDFDGVIDDCDGCPTDPAKTNPGVCGCGTPDDDGDGDGFPDCVDGCPSDPDKTGPGICGCGVSDDDSDGDGVPDCFDGCPGDPSKVDPGVCGCGVSDDDGDGDGFPDCVDGCPNDPGKVDPGVCGCGVPDDDSDGDGVLDCLDGCPNDPDKTAPGQCGCGARDDDGDGDGVADCNDGCPSDPFKVDPGVCGCGVSDNDFDGDGVADCMDNCVLLPNPGQEDCNGNGSGDACDIADGTSGDCNANGVPDECDIDGGVSEDCDGNGVPDECETLPAPEVTCAAVTSHDCEESSGGSGASQGNEPTGLSDGCLAVDVNIAGGTGELNVEVTIETECGSMAVESGQVISLVCLESDAESSSGESGHSGSSCSACPAAHSGSSGGAGNLPPMGGGMGFSKGCCYMELVDGILYIRAEYAVLNATVTDECGQSSSCSLDMCTLVCGSEEPSPVVVRKPGCRHDLDGDGVVGQSDIVALIEQWNLGAGPGSAADFDGDGAVGPFDLLDLFGAVGPCP